MTEHTLFWILVLAALLGGEAWRRLRIRKAEDIIAKRVINEERQRKSRGKVV